MAGFRVSVFGRFVVFVGAPLTKSPYGGGIWDYVGSYDTAWHGKTLL